MANQSLNAPLGLADQLFNIASATARSHGFQFDAQTETEIRTFITAGVTKLIKDDRKDERAKVSKMVDDTVRLVEMMIQSSPHQEFSLATPGTYLLASVDFAAVKRWFCPCYPFC